ncbi:MAG: glycine betaine/L-proline ABC transporter ATP-binding protein ProV [Desulfobacterales bacterium]
MDVPEEIIRVTNLFKIFGPDPKAALPMLEKDRDKESIYQETGNTVAVQNANLSIKKKEIFVIMGLSGSGKSTIVRMFNRLIEPTAGQVFILGEDITRLGKKEIIRLRRRKMSMVFQSFALMPRMKVWENAAFGLDVSGFSPHERRERAMAALEQVGLAANADSYPDELSGGMQQRVGLARALAMDPEIMLMDEAFSALDPLIRAEMQDELLALQADTGRTVVFISHDLDEAMRIGDRIAIMEGGRIIQVGAPDEILQNPADEYVRSFFRGVDPTKVLTAGDVAQDKQVTIIHSPELEKGLRAALQRLIDYDRECAYVLDRKRKYQGIISVDSLQRVIRDKNPLFQKALLDAPAPVQADTLLEDVLPLVTNGPYPVPVVDRDGIYRGSISRTTYLKALQKGEES